MNIRERGFAQLMAACLWLYDLAPYVVLLNQGTTDTCYREVYNPGEPSGYL